ncbi:hypothetical protein BVG16_10680 [Paenibacillus selenitireducens]|uniref:Response regulatory domain-containing protein n=1 Tax=Paenibacillus selenitireducens TaxID=1324314 RepID=A0A1T2XEN6_9BACL|nr:response regulator [Paenibacillus selenitireducens]OPA78344.1 hypothetical protein BVG16_10680 [Paenibacillus selenitireducens]
MFNVVIVEDEVPALELMKYIISRNSHYNIQGEFTNPIEALREVPNLRPDVVFLDVEMPNLNGLELAHRLLLKLDDLQVVFTTAYKTYALDAFEVNAVDYILKPVTPASIERVAQRLLKNHHPKTSAVEMGRTAHIQCFGDFEVRSARGEWVRWPTRKTEELFAYLLCHAGKEMSKWRLADLLWPDMDEERASHNLYNTVYRLKKILKEHNLGMELLKRNEGYTLDSRSQRVDVVVFQQYDFTLPEDQIDIEQLEQLCALYKGPLFGRKDYLWKVSLEEVYAKQYRMLVRTLNREDGKRQAWSRMEQRLHAFLLIYPLDEEMNQAILEVYERSGNRDLMMKHYTQFELGCRKELGIDPPQAMRDWALVHVHGNT